MQTSNRHGRQGERGWTLAAVVVLVAVQQGASLDHLRLFGQTLSNVLHFPLFVTITLLLTRAFPTFHLPVIGCIAAVIALATEGIQLFNQRHASLFDVALNGAGIAIAVTGLAIARSLKPDATRTRRLFTVWLSIAAIVIVGTLALPMRVLLAYDHRDRSFPVIWDASAWPGTLMLAGNSQYRLVAAPASWQERAGQRVLEVIWADVPHPRIQVLEVVPDWSGYRTVVVDVYLPEGPPLPLTVALGRRDEMIARRVSTAQVRSGPQRLTFELAEHEAIAAVDRLVLRVPHSAAGRTLLIGRIALGQP